MDTRPHRSRLIFTALILGVVVIGFLSLRYGAISIAWSEITNSFYSLMGSGDTLTLNERIFLDIRLPRAIACFLVGGSLAVSGVLMQGLFRNPIVEPGLIGTSSGAAFGAALYFVLGATFRIHLNEWTLPLAACAGGVLSTGLVFLLSRSRISGKSSVFSLLLTGIAVNALFLSGVGFLSYIARDPQARSITFWNLGTLSGSNWASVIALLVSFLVCLFWALRQAGNLNALMMGEDEAMLIGVDVRRLKRTVMGINVILVAVATSFTGVIAFVGLIVPHLLRLLHGSDNRYLITGSALLGGILLSAADLIARLTLAPSELPIGIVTSLVGVPVFVVLLRKSQYSF
ncbi:MAG: iron ABC transporter permease [Cyclobacteriaceae bacterium]|nr:iron ABC transporter permease [Cyclobacteriaceae bacterium]